MKSAQSYASRKRKSELSFDFKDQGQHQGGRRRSGTGSRSGSKSPANLRSNSRSITRAKEIVMSSKGNNRNGQMPKKKLKKDELGMYKARLKNIYSSSPYSFFNEI